MTVILYLLQVNNISGYLPGRIVFFLVQILYLLLVFYIDMSLAYLQHAKSAYILYTCMGHCVHRLII